MPLRALQFIAIILTAIALIPAGTHLFEMSNKINLPREAYFVVQNIYSGWDLFGIVYVGALMANGALAVRLRHQRLAFYFAGTAALSFVLFFIVFFFWTFPANQATLNWTSVPPSWDTLRSQWEYSHALSAFIIFIGLMAVTLSVVIARHDQG
jgi:hypothetical protein